ncbi:hypothetical protein FZW96_00160 [Bacillus sp. BGMRC 2118]|nr:hypothetical protein FZW96_00160 [Bacillus sp. BGMRC 2118]
MSNKANKELEKGMKQALQGLQKLKNDTEEKEYKRFWSDIQIPFSLTEGLRQYPKHELDTIRKKLEIKNASSLKKDDLVSVLHENILSRVEQFAHKWDLERFNLITSIASSGGVMNAPYLESEQLNYLRATGLVFTGIHKGKHILSVPQEVIPAILALKNNVSVRAKVSQNTEWIQLANGLLFYYGTLRTIQLIEMVKNYTLEDIDTVEFTSIMQDANDYQKQHYVDMNGYSTRRVFDPKEVLKEHNMRQHVSFYPFTKDQLLAAGEVGFVDRNVSYKQFVSFLMKNYNMTQEEADSIVEECVYATNIGHSPNQVMQYLANIVTFEAQEDVQAMMTHLVYLMNNTREWFLKGYMPTELKPQNQDSQTAVQIPPAANVGRNDPCPCGSGKKYKKCCGK